LENQAGMGCYHSCGPFWLLFGQAKSNRKKFKKGTITSSSLFARQAAPFLVPRFCVCATVASALIFYACLIELTFPTFIVSFFLL
jgi:hypothetical protein